MIVVTSPAAILTDAWQTIRARNPGVPDATIVVTHAPRSGCATVSWSDGPVLMADGELVSSTPREILAWLLHQAAHGLAAARGDKPGATEGRYHSKVFKKAAEDVGLVPKDPSPGRGWHATDLPTPSGYQDTLDRLRGLQGFEAPTVPARTKATTRDNAVAAWCACNPPRRIRVSASMWDEDISCGRCGEVFKPR